MDVQGPTFQATDAVLQDGSTVHVRAVLPSDEDALFQFYSRLSDRSRRSRFFAYGTDLENAARRACRSDSASFGLLALRGAEHQVVAHAGYERFGPQAAEVAFAVADELQGHGVGTILLGQLAEVGAPQGIKVFKATLLPSNYQMLDVLRQSGFPVEVEAGPDELVVTYPALLTPAGLDEFDRR